MLTDTEIEAETRKRYPIHMQLSPENYRALRSYAQKNNQTMNKQMNLLLRDFFQEQAQREKSA